MIRDVSPAAFPWQLLTEPGEPRDPVTGKVHGPNERSRHIQGGMTQRQYFAAHANEEDVKAAISDLGSRYVTTDDTPLKIKFNASRTESQRRAIGRLYFADAMMKAADAMLRVGES